MKKAVVFLVVLPMVLLLFLPIPIPGWSGSYNTFSRLIWCETDFGCYHEIGHKLDQEGGWISRTHDFAVAVQAYLIIELKKEHPDPLVYVILVSPGLFEYDGIFTNHHAELYARIFEYGRGERNRLPERFSGFYDWERAAELMKKYTR